MAWSLSQQGQICGLITKGKGKTNLFPTQTAKEKPPRGWPCKPQLNDDFHLENLPLDPCKQEQKQMFSMLVTRADFRRKQWANVSHRWMVLNLIWEHLEIEAE